MNESPTAREMKDEIRRRMRREFDDPELFDRAHGFAREYIDGAVDQRVVPDAAAVARLAEFEESLPEEPSDGGEILRLLHEHGSPNTNAQIAGRYFGFVNGGAVPAALAAKWLADVWDQNGAFYVMSPIVSKLEDVCQAWLVDLLGLPEGTVAGFVSGTSISTTCGLVAARNEILRRQQWDAGSRGLFGAPEIRVIISEQAHGSVFKALALIGLGRERVELVPADGEGRMRADALPKLDGSCIVLTQAGNVNSGAFDALDKICAKANAAGAWVHVDGAFGLWAAASPKYRHLCRGLEMADSWSLDAHKTLNAPYDSGIILCRHGEALVAALQASGSYLQFSAERDGSLYTPDMSRRARSVELWATMKFLGRAGIAGLIDGLCDRAREFAERLGAEGFRIVNDVVFNQVLVAGKDADETRAVLAGVQASGECWCGGAEWHGEPVIRVSVSSWATTPEDVIRSVAAFVKARAEARN